MKNKSVEFLVDLVKKYPVLDPVFPSILEATEALTNCFKNKNKLIFGVDAHAPWDFDRIDYNYFSKFLTDLNLSDNDILKELEFKNVK